MCNDNDGQLEIFRQESEESSDRSGDTLQHAGRCGDDLIKERNEYIKELSKRIKTKNDE